MNLSIQGTGDRAILFIHGFCETMGIWETFSAGLKDEYTVITIDLPGHGESVLIKSEFSIEDIADHVMNELKSHGINQCFVIGHSLGGYISLALCELYPESITGFGLFSSTTFPDDEEKKKVRDKVGSFIEEHGHKEFIDSFVPNLFTPENRRKFTAEIENLKLEAYKTSTESIVAYSQAMKNRPDRTQLLSSDKPKFIIAGDRDMAVKIDASREMLGYISASDGLILKDTGHNGFLEDTTAALSFIKSFLTRYQSNI